MSMTLYKDGRPVGQIEVPQNIVDMAVSLGRWMEMNNCEQLFGIGPAFSLTQELTQVKKERDTLRGAFIDLQEDLVDSLQQIEKLTKERDTYKAMLDLQNMRAERMMEGNGK